jgi:hypothetical protein
MADSSIAEEERMTATIGIINAKPKDLSTNVPLAKVLEVSDFLNAPENRDKIQFPSDETRFGWVNMSRYYQTAQVRRSGPISELGYQIDSSIGDISYQNPEGETLTVNSHFETLSIDALIVVKGGSRLVLYERRRESRRHDGAGDREALEPVSRSLQVLRSLDFVFPI